jgi:hypothetical protein
MCKAIYNDSSNHLRHRLTKDISAAVGLAAIATTAVMLEEKQFLGGFLEF